MHDEAPKVRVVRGTPTAEELAALVGALLTRTPAAPPPALSRWARSARPGATTAGRPARRGPDAWRTSALPR